MKLKKIAQTFLACLMLIVIPIGIKLTQAGYVAKADEYQVSLASGTHEKWIDRIDLSNAKYAKDLYDWLVENSDNDGQNDVLIDASQNEYLILNVTTNFSVDVSKGEVAELVKSESERIANDLFEKVTAYSIMAYAAFNRDYNEVFWLQREVVTFNAYSTKYNNTGDATITQDISLLIKQQSSNPAENYDIRLEDYVNGTLDIKQEIANVNNAIDSIMSGIATDATRYEKVKYFNDYLVKNNCYAKTATKNSRDCRGALLGQKGNSAYAPVCEGYARAFKVLCDRAGIPCVLSSGVGKVGSVGEDHMWNLVQMENGNWYGVDVTWNDPTVGSKTDKVSGAESEDYLLVGKVSKIDGKRFADSHQEINQMYQNGVALNNGPMLSSEKYGAPVVVAEWDVSKTIGVDNVKATLYKTENFNLVKPTYKLIISGKGAVKEYSNVTDCPWNTYSNKIIQLEIREDISEVLGIAFSNLEKLEIVQINGNLTFGNNTFYNSGVEFFCHENTSTYGAIQNLGYTLSSLCSENVTKWSVKTKKSCEEDEVLTGTCLICAKILEKVGESKLGHDYLEWTVIENPTMQSNGQLQRICNNDSTHKESLEIPALTSNEYSSSVVTEPTCENDGIERYVLVVGGQEITVDYTLKAIGHDYGAPEYTWSENFMQCVAKRCCANDSAHVISENAIVTTSEEVKCSTDGYITYTATFGKSDFTIQQRTEYHAPTDHTFSNTLSFDDTKHWHNCEFCSERTDENDHEYGEWQIEKAPSIFYKGLKKKSCVCGHFKEEDVPKKQFIKSIIEGDLSFAEKYILIAIAVVVGIILISILIKIGAKRKNKKA